MIFVSINREFSELEAQAITSSYQRTGQGLLHTGGEVKYHPIMYAEKVCAIYAASSANAALWAQQAAHTNSNADAPAPPGQVVRVGLLPTAFHFSFPDIYANVVWHDQSALQNFPEMHEIYVKPGFAKTKDGKSVVVGVLSDKEWKQARSVLGDRMRVPPEKEEAWSTIPGRFVDGAALRGMFQEMVAKLDYQEFEDLAVKAELINGRVRNRDEVLQDPQILSNKSVETHQHPSLGSVRLAKPAATFHNTPQSIRSLAPLPGEHSVEVLKEAGFSDQEVQELQKSRTLQGSE